MTRARDHAGRGPLSVGRARSAGSVGNDDGADDLVGDRLPLGVPQREEEADVADDGVDEVADVAYQGHEHADRLAGLLADQPQVQRPLAERLAGCAGLIPAVVDAPANGGQPEEDRQDDDPDQNDGQDDEDDLRKPVDQIRADALAPIGVRGHGWCGGVRGVLISHGWPFCAGVWGRVVNYTNPNRCSWKIQLIATTTSMA